MSETVSIPTFNLVLFMLLTLIPAAVLFIRKLPIWKEVIIAVLRMAVQLSLIGFYLQFLFKYNSPVLNIAWVLVMICIANMTIIKRVGLRRRLLFFSTGIGIFISTSLVGVTLLLTVGIRPLYDAHYLIPLIGMILGNTLQGNVIALERFYSSLRSEQKLYELLLFNGASNYEALTPFMNNALTAAISPAVGGMMTTGLVALPGMMTGQILGGTVPIEAIKYQIVIMAAIFLAIFLSIILNLLITPRITFNAYGVLKSDIYQK